MHSDKKDAIVCGAVIGLMLTTVSDLFGESGNGRLAGLSWIEELKESSLFLAEQDDRHLQSWKLNYNRTLPCTTSLLNTQQQGSAPLKARWSESLLKSTTIFWNGSCLNYTSWSQRQHCSYFWIWTSTRRKLMVLAAISRLHSDDLARSKALYADSIESGPKSNS